MTTRLYEGMVLLDNREVKKDFEGLRRRIGEILEKHGARVVAARKWDERKLAYEIRGQKRATYYIAFFEGPGGAIPEVRRELYLTEGVMRCLLLTAESVPEWAFHDPPPDRVEEEVLEGDEVAGGEEEPSEETPEAIEAPVAGRSAADLKEDSEPSKEQEVAR